MKLRSVSVLFIILLFIVASCVSRHAVVALMDSAELVMNESPEQSYGLMSDIDPHSISGRAIQARYALLYTEAQYKNYINETSDVQTHKFLGKELDRMYGLDWYDLGVRRYDAAAETFWTMDPLCEKYYHINPYAYCNGNPIMYIDTDGRETRVAMNVDGTYRVIGGELNKDKNIYLYTKDKEGNYTVRGNSIGISSSTTSFYDSDLNDGKGAWAVGSIINPNDKSGDYFLGDIFGNTPPMFTDYIANAGNGEKYDFKTTNGKNSAIEGINKYRGMPIGETGNGQTIYSSARDIGNIAAGYVAGANGMSWTASRIAFDIYQSKVNRKLTIEGISTRNAQRYGWRIGSSIYNNTPTQKSNNLLKSIWDCFKM